MRKLLISIAISLFTICTFAHPMDCCPYCMQDDLTMARDELMADGGLSQKIAQTLPGQQWVITGAFFPLNERIYKKNLTAIAKIAKRLNSRLGRIVDINLIEASDLFDATYNEFDMRGLTMRYYLYTYKPEILHHFLYVVLKEQVPVFRNFAGRIGLSSDLEGSINFGEIGGLEKLENGLNGQSLQYFAYKKIDTLLKQEVLGIDQLLSNRYPYPNITNKFSMLVHDKDGTMEPVFNW